MWEIPIKEMEKRNYNFLSHKERRPYLISYPKDPDKTNCKKYNGLVDKYNEILEENKSMPFTEQNLELMYRLSLEDSYIIGHAYGKEPEYDENTKREFERLVEKEFKRSPLVYNIIRDKFANNLPRHTEEIAQETIASGY